MAEKLIGDKDAVTCHRAGWVCGVARSPYHVIQRNSWTDLSPHKYGRGIYHVMPLESRYLSVCWKLSLSLSFLIIVENYLIVLSLETSTDLAHPELQLI